MKLTKAGEDFIKAWEGFQPIPYHDASGRKTIGYGHVVGEDDEIDQQPISGEHAETLFRRDVKADFTEVVRITMDGYTYTVQQPRE